MRLIKEKDLPDFETGHTEDLRSAVRWVMKVSISLLFCFTLLVIIQKTPECCNFLHDILSSEVAPCLHLSLDTQTFHTKYQRRP